MEGQLPGSPPPVPPPAPAPVAAPVQPPARPMPPPTKKGTSSILLAILGVVMVGGIAFAGLTFWQRGLLASLPFLSKPTPTPTLAPEPTPTLDPTAGWKTYTNAKYGFEFKYPADWEVRDLLSPEDSSKKPATKVFLGFAPVTIKEDVLGGITVSTDSLEKVASDTKKIILVEGTMMRLVSEEETSFNTFKAREIIFENTLANVKVKYVAFTNSAMTYLINTGGTQDEKYLKSMDQILATFEFLTPTPTGTQTKGGTVQGTPVKIKSISLTSPTKGPLVIKGTVESGWMFEGTMPVKLLDVGRTEIATGSAKETTPGSWQSGKAADFSVSLTFTTQSASGFLVFQNDNPSGLPANQKSFELSVKFRQQ